MAALLHPQTSPFDQQRIWTAVVSTEAAELFTTAALQELLKAFVRHLDAAHRLARFVIRDTKKELECPDLGTVYRALSAEASMVERRRRQGLRNNQKNVRGRGTTPEGRG